MCVVWFLNLFGVWIPDDAVAPSDTFMSLGLLLCCHFSLCQSRTVEGFARSLPSLTPMSSMGTQGISETSVSWGGDGLLAFKNISHSTFSNLEKLTARHTLCLAQQKVNLCSHEAFF